MKTSVIKTIQWILPLLPILLKAQSRIINKAEDFTTGKILIFQEATDGIIHIIGKDNSFTWDFSKIKILSSKTNTQNIVSPETTPFHNLFPNANLVEKNSDGSYVYILKNENENHLVGFVRTKGNEITIKYENPMLLIKRPIQSGDSISDEFSTEYSVRGMDFKGKGVVTIKTDGYGKLLLPNKKYDNVLLIVIKQVQYDTLLQYSTVTKTETTYRLWFDNKHTSALLKITETKSDSYKRKIEYLLSEN